MTYATTFALGGFFIGALYGASEGWCIAVCCGLALAFTAGCIGNAFDPTPSNSSTDMEIRGNPGDYQDLDDG